MAKQTFTTGQVLTAAQMTSLQQTAMGGGAPVTKTGSYVLTAADAGTVIQMNAAGATTITVNTSLFSAGDSVFIQNIGAGTCTITAGTATVTTSGSLSLGQWEGGQLYFTSTGASIFWDYTQSASSAVTFVGCSLYSSANTTVATATYTAIGYNTENFDTDNFHSTSSSTDRITIPAGKGGKYLFVVNGEFAANATGTRVLRIRKNAASTVAYVALYGSASVGTCLSVTGISDAVATDYFTAEVYQSSGGNLTFFGGSDAVFACTYLGA